MTTLTDPAVPAPTVPAPAARRPARTAHRAGAADAPGRPGEITGRVHSWDLSVGVDGPGTRFSVFTAGCLLRCLYCENPDTWDRQGGSPTTVDEVMRRIRRFAPTLRLTGGGVTVTGGEPLLQPAFTGALLHDCHEAGLHTAVDTSGFLGRNADDDMLADIDLVLLDVKAIDPALYRRVTGQRLGPTLTFADRLAAHGTPTWIRFVLVPGLTDDPGHVARLADHVAGLGNVERVDVLGYHRLGEGKYAALGLDYPLAGVPTPTADQVAAARAVFAARGLAVT